MQILSINRILKWVQITSGGRKYTCPIREIDGEVFFAFKNQWHKVMEYTSEFTTELISKNGKVISQKIKFDRR